MTVAASRRLAGAASKGVSTAGSGACANAPVETTITPRTNSAMRFIRDLQLKYTQILRAESGSITRHLLGGLQVQPTPVLGRLQVADARPARWRAMATARTTRIDVSDRTYVPGVHQFELRMEQRDARPKYGRPLQNQLRQHVAVL